MVAIDLKEVEGLAHTINLDKPAEMLTTHATVLVMPHGIGLHEATICIGPRTLDRHLHQDQDIMMEMWEKCMSFAAER